MPAHAPSSLFRASCGLALAFWLGAGAAMAQAPELDVPYVSTPPGVVDRMLELAEVTSHDYVIDLGSGDGRIVIAAARDYGARGFGVDIDPRRIEEATLNAERAGLSDRVDFRVEDLFETRIEDATVLTMYLLSSVNRQLKPRILEELQPGTRVVSHAFSLGDWEPDQHEQVEGKDVFLWIVPAQVEGAWTLQDGDTTMTLDLTQNFQYLRGTATADGRTDRITSGRIEGETISFTLDRGMGEQRSFSGRVEGDRIHPVGQGDWHAERAS